MTNNQQTASNNRLSTWLLNVTLLFSLLTFSGFTTNDQSQQNQTARTELPVSVSINSKRTVSYKKLSTPFYNKVNSRQQQVEFSQSLLIYAISVKTRLDNNSKQVINFNTIEYSFEIKRDPHFSDEDDLNSIRG